MKTILFLLPFAFASSAVGDLSEVVTKEKLIKNLEIETQSFVTSSDGKRILEVTGDLAGTKFEFQPDTHATVARTWTTEIDGMAPVNLTYRILVADDLSLSIEVEQYKTLKPKPQGLIKKGTLIFKDFDSASWVANVSSEKNIVVRFLPKLPGSLEPEQLKSPIMALTDIIALDNANRLWSRGLGGASEVIVLGSPYGRLFLSFIPFQGAKEIGFAQGDEIQMHLDQKKVVRIRSREAIIGGGVRAKVYGAYQEKVTEPAYAHSGDFMTAAKAAKQLAGPVK